MTDNSYLTCPSCPTAFRTTTGLVRHLTDDHWWVYEEAFQMTQEESQAMAWRELTGD